MRQGYARIYTIAKELKIEDEYIRCFTDENAQKGVIVCYGVNVQLSSNENPLPFNYCNLDDFDSQKVIEGIDKEKGTMPVFSAELKKICPNRKEYVFNVRYHNGAVSFLKISSMKEITIN